MTAQAQAQVGRDAQAGRIPGLDGLRAISILLVVLGHTSNGLHLTAGSAAYYAAKMIGHQALGVQMFFVLSGFLITQLLLDEHERTGTIGLGGFYFRRAFRILPAYYLYLAVASAVLVFREQPLNGVSLFAAASFLWTYLPNDGQWLLGHCWSLCIEEQFYLFWPAVLRWLGPRRGLVFALGVVALSPVMRVAIYFLVPAWRGGLTVMPHARLDGLMAGCALALAARLGWADVLRRWSRNPWLLLPGMLWLFTGDPLLGEVLRGKYLLTVGYTLQSALLALLVYRVAEGGAGRVDRWLNARLPTWLGQRSYSLYLWQQPFTQIDVPALERVYPAGVGLAFAAAAASYRFVEQPFLRLRARLSRSRLAVAPTP